MEVKNQKLISVIVFLIIGILFFDNNCFLKEPLHTVVKGKSLEFSARRSREYPAYFLLDESGMKYKVPGGLYGYINTEDSLIVTRSLLFNKAIRIESYKKF